MFGRLDEINREIRESEVLNQQIGGTIDPTIIKKEEVNFSDKHAMGCMIGAFAPGEIPGGVSASCIINAFTEMEANVLDVNVIAAWKEKLDDSSCICIPLAVWAANITDLSV